MWKEELLAEVDGKTGVCAGREMKLVATAVTAGQALWLLEKAGESAAREDTLKLCKLTRHLALLYSLCKLVGNLAH